MSDKSEAIKSKRSLTSSKGVAPGIKEQERKRERVGRKEDKVRKAEGSIIRAKIVSFAVFVRSFARKAVKRCWSNLFKMEVIEHSFFFPFFNFYLFLLRFTEIIYTEICHDFYTSVLL